MSPNVQEESDRESIILIAVEAVPAGSKPPAAVGVRISTGEIHGFGASAPLSTRASPTDSSGAGGSAIMLKLAKLVGSPSTLAEELSPFMTRSAAEAPYVCLQIFLSGSMSASVAKRGGRASCSRPAKRRFVFFSFVSSSLRPKWLVHFSKHLSSPSENIRRIYSIVSPPNPG